MRVKLLPFERAYKALYHQGSTELIDTVLGVDRLWWSKLSEKPVPAKFIDNHTVVEITSKKFPAFRIPAICLADIVYTDAEKRRLHLCDSGMKV